MKVFNWNSENNRILIDEREISFEDIIFSIQQGDLLDDLIHPNSDKYSNQKILIVNVDDYNYAYLVLYVENDTEIFLKTIIPSRKATKEYLRGAYE